MSDSHRLANLFGSVAEVFRAKSQSELKAPADFAPEPKCMEGDRDLFLGWKSLKEKVDQVLKIPAQYGRGEFNKTVNHAPCDYNSIMLYITNDIYVNNVWRAIADYINDRMLAISRTEINCHSRLMNRQELAQATRLYNEIYPNWRLWIQDQVLNPKQQEVNDTRNEIDRLTSELESAEARYHATKFVVKEINNYFRHHDDF